MFKHREYAEWLRDRFFDSTQWRLGEVGGASGLCSSARVCLHFLLPETIEVAGNLLMSE